MPKHPLSSIISGILLIAGGIAIFLVVLLSSEEGIAWILIYGIPMFVLGIVLLIWKKEDDIEQRKDLVKGGKK